MMRNVEQLTADQEQMTREITKLREIEQSIRRKNTEPSARAISASAPKPYHGPRRNRRAPDGWSRSFFVGGFGKAGRQQ